MGIHFYLVRVQCSYLFFKRAMQNKINMEKTYERRREKERKNDRNGLDKDELVFDLENFMTLDAVGSVDGKVDGT